MNPRWEYKKLSAVCDRISDGLHGTPHYADDGEFYFINGNNLKSGFISITKDTKRVSRDEYETHKVKLDDSTLLLSLNGTVGEMALYRGEPIILGKSAAYINCREVDRRFCYYYFQLQGIQDAFFNVATGSTIKNLGLESLKNFSVPVNPEKELRKVATLLSTLDAKIELNHRINEQLVAMAKLLYDYWFVQFDFPISAHAGAMVKPQLEGKPYRSTGGKMVYNEILKREIPEKWEVANILAISDLRGGATPSKKRSEFWGGVIPFFTPTDATNEPFCLDTEEHITQLGLTDNATRLYPRELSLLRHVGQ